MTRLLHWPFFSARIAEFGSGEPSAGVGCCSGHRLSRGVHR